MYHFALLQTLLPWHNVTPSAEDCFALVSDLPLHHCDKGQSPNTMAASSWWPDSLPNHSTLLPIGWFNIVKGFEAKHHLSHCFCLSHNSKGSNYEKRNDRHWSSCHSLSWTLRCLLRTFTAACSTPCDRWHTQGKVLLLWCNNVPPKLQDLFVLERFKLSSPCSLACRP